MGRELKKKPKKPSKKKKPDQRNKKKMECDSTIGTDQFKERGFSDETPPTVFGSLEELWEKYPEETWYLKGASYWENISSDDNGMLGGLTELKAPDEADSKELLKLLQTEHHVGKEKVCDCGGGIGRVSQNVLAHYFDQLTLVEQCPAFVKTAVETIPKLEGINQGFQDWEPAEAHYDVIWCQWCVGHLRDTHFIDFVQRAFKGADFFFFLFRFVNFCESRIAGKWSFGHQRQLVH
jgi:protein N-terminal methyltransferase